MISLELSTIQHKDAERAWLAERVNMFLSTGGPLEEAPVLKTKPRPAVRVVASPAQVKERAMRRMQAQAKEIELVAKVKAAAETMTIKKAAAHLEMSRYVLQRIANQHRFTFQSGKAERRQALVQFYATPEEDAKDADRLRQYAALGTSIHHAAKHSGIGAGRASRLAKDFNITFPPRGKA